MNNKNNYGFRFSYYKILSMIHLYSLVPRVMYEFLGEGRPGNEAIYVGAIVSSKVMQ